MAPTLDKIVVIDVESTCWKGSVPPDQVSEIIEIGVCTLDPYLRKIEGKQSILVKPIQSDVSAFCNELTTITPEMVSDAGTLAEALDKLHDEYDTPNRLWASWGDYDRTMFEKECERKGLDYPFGRSHQNAKTLFGLMYGYKKAPGMTRALKRLDFELEGTHHRGHDDAYNIARILRECLKGP
jgi:inhibitor of KinA sporulation pathway (predicted exonuclease)